MPPKRRVQEEGEEEEEIVVLDDNHDDSVIVLEDDGDDDNFAASDEEEDEGLVEEEDLDVEEEEFETAEEDGLEEFDDDEDVDMDISLDERMPLMFVGDESLEEKLETFAMSFESRYGETHPLFYPGPLRDAKLQSLSHPTVQERRPLAIYVHSDESPYSDRFPQEVFCTQLFTEFISANFITFGWDATQKPNKKILVDALREEGMDYVSRTLEFARKREFPLLLLVSRTKEITFKLSGVVYGSDTIDTAITKMEAVANDMKEFITAESRAIRERQERESLRQQQQAEYDESLRVDRAERLAKQEAQAKLEAEQAEAQRQEEEKQRRIAEQTAALPEEPAASEADIVTLKFNLPGQPAALRRFRKSDTIRLLTVFVESKGFFMEEYDILNSDRPMKSIVKHFDLDKTFGELNWPSRECLNVGLR